MINEIFKEIEREREAQDKQHGGASHDENHSLKEWLAFIRKQLDMIFSPDPVSARKRLINIAALCVASIQAVSRKNFCESCKHWNMQGSDWGLCKKDDPHEEPVKDFVIDYVWPEMQWNESCDDYDEGMYD